MTASQEEAAANVDSGGEALVRYFRDAQHCCDPDEVAGECVAALWDAGYVIVPRDQVT